MLRGAFDSLAPDVLLLLLWAPKLTWLTSSTDSIFTCATLTESRAVRPSMDPDSSRKVRNKD